MKIQVIHPSDPMIALNPAGSSTCKPVNETLKVLNSVNDINEQYQIDQN